MIVEVKTFANERFGAIRTTVNEQGQPLFCGKDVAEALGYKNAAKAIRTHCKGVTEMDTPSNGGSQKTKFITEGDLYRLVMSSQLPDAQMFQDWVCDVVLPQIRMTGGYIPVDEGDDEESMLSKALKVAHRTIELKNRLIDHQREVIESQRHQISQQLPMVRFADAVTSCRDSILIRDLAKLITQNGVKIGQARLFYWLRTHGYLFQRDTRPIQKWVEMGLFDTDVKVVSSCGNRVHRLTTRVTGLGQRYFLEGFLSGRFKADNQSLADYSASA